MYMNLVRGFLEQGNLGMAYQLRDDFTTCSIRNKIAILDSVFVEHLFKQGKDEEAMELYRSSVNNKDGLTANGTVGNPYLKLLLKYSQKNKRGHCSSICLTITNAALGSTKILSI
ncbi:BnaC01g35530D [Brassica napus]|uniref:BnaC01g35530D protein n=2 Tax=Brassica napus TaxID=3708 RepID=A0A078GUR6_BRANA|nr:BnaC01g35530D [Brassica napus]